MDNQNEPFDLFMTAYEVFEKVGGVVEVRSEKRRVYRLTIKNDFRAEDRFETDYGLSIRQRNGFEDNFFATENLRRWSSDLNAFVDRIKRRSANENRSSLEENIRSTQGKSKVGNIKFKSLVEEIKPLAIELMKIATSNLGNKFLLQWDILVSTTTKTFTSSIGSHIFQQIPTALFTFHLTQKSPPFSSLHSMVGGIEKENVSWEKLVKALNTHIDEANRLTMLESFNGSKSNLVFSHDATWTLMHELIGHGVEKSIEYQSYLDGREGLKIAPSNVSIIDDKGIPSIGTYGFDDEGNKATGTVVIEEGILNSFLYDNKTALEEGVASTGNARAVSVNSPPKVRQSNLFLEPGDFEEGELFEEVKNGVYIGPSQYAFSEPARGVVTIVPQYLQKIEGGELKEMYAPFPITWNFNEIIPKLTGVSKSLMNKPTYCTKEDGKLGVGMVSPMIMAKDVRFSP